MRAVPPDPAGNTAEPGVLAARHERGAALLTDPLIRHSPMLRREYGGAERSGATGGPGNAANRVFSQVAGDTQRDLRKRAQDRAGGWSPQLDTTACPPP